MTTFGNSWNQIYLLLENREREKETALETWWTKSNLPVILDLTKISIKIYTIRMNFSREINSCDDCAASPVSHHSSL